MNNTTFTPTADVLALGTYYIATNYNIKPDNAADMNTENLQKLVDQVSANGGGTIYFPVGTYYFGIGDTLLRKDTTIPYSIKMESNVSIIGQNTEKTVLKQICETSTDDNGNEIPNPYSLFVYLNPVNESTKGENGTPVFPENFIPITGCTYSNFTVDASETTKPAGTNIYYAKAFYYQYVKNCVFRDLLLKGTLGTALGIDYLDNVQVENVNCFQCGRNFFDNKTATGSSAIGIGTGGWKNENFYIHNCTCVESGQYGIFIENQTRFGWGSKELYSKGCIISNCITRNGRHRGIGVRGGQYVTVTGCESYENAADGIYLDGYCKNVKISNCNSAVNANGIYLTDEISGNKFEMIVFSGNVIEENTEKGILIDGAVTDLVITNNHVKGNTTALHVSANAYIDCIVKDNVFFGTIENHGSYAGNLQHNELLEDCDFCLSIPYGDFTQNMKIEPYGTITELSANSKSMTTDYIDISNLSGNSFTFGLSSKVNMFRVAQYKSNEKLESIDNFIQPSTDYFYSNKNEPFDFIHTISKKSNAKFIRVFVEYSSNPITDNFFVSFYN